MLKPSDNPPMLTPGVAAAAELPGDWHVCHVRPRNEKAFAFDAMRGGLGHFLPMVPRVTFSGGRRRRAMVPVFAGYVFVCGGADARYRAVSTGRVVSVLSAGDNAALVAEVTQIERALAASADLSFYPHLAVGRAVRVSAGPLAGLCGRVIERREGDLGGVRDGEAQEARPTLIVLNVSLLGGGASVAVEPSLLVPADDGDPPVTTTRRRSYELVDPPPRRRRPDRERAKQPIGGTL